VSLIPEVMRMSGVQLSINVSDLGAAVAFYSRLFGTAPAKPRRAMPTSPAPARRSSWC